MEKTKTQKQARVMEDNELVTARELISVLQLVSSLTCSLCRKLTIAVENKRKEDKERGFRI